MLNNINPSEIPLVVLDLQFNIISLNDSAKRIFNTFFKTEYIKRILEQYSPQYFSSPRYINASPFSIENMRFFVFPQDEYLNCYILKENIPFILKNTDIISAQLRDPVTNMFATLPLLTDSINKSDSERSFKNIEIMYQNTYIILKNINNVTLSSRLMQKEYKDDNIFNLSTLLTNTIDGVRLVLKGNVTLNCQCDENIFVKGSIQLISNAIFNFILNSILYKSDEDPIITFVLKSKGKTCALTISDNGMGIKDAILPFIFEPYFTSNPYDDGEPSLNLGLGLYIAKKAFEYMGGNILTQSKFGKGTTFIISIPVADTSESSLVESTPLDLVLNRYSDMFIQLSTVCRLPDIY